jgi:hypothetical protein
MMQGGPPVEIVVPMMGMITGVVIVGMVFLGPVGRSIGEAIRYWLAGGHRRQQAIQPGDLDEVHDRLDVMQRQLGELAERQDFAERLIANTRKERGLPGAGGGAG